MLVIEKFINWRYSLFGVDILIYGGIVMYIYWVLIIYYVC